MVLCTVQSWCDYRLHANGNRHACCDILSTLTSYYCAFCKS